MAEYRGTHRAVALIHPRGHSRKEVFYTRGDDIFKEPEWTEDELRTLRRDHDQAQTALVEASDLYDAVRTELDETENYTVKLASKINGKKDPTTENAELRHDIEVLTAEMQRMDDQHREAVARANIKDLAILEKELGTFPPQMEGVALERKADAAVREEKMLRAAELMITEPYAISVEAVCERRVALICRNNLKKSLEGLHKTLDAGPSEGKSKRTAGATAVRNDRIHQLGKELLEFRLQDTEAELQRDLSKVHWKCAVRQLVSRVEEMNDMISLLGSDRTVDIQQVKETVGWEELEEYERQTNEQAAVDRQKANDRRIPAEVKGRGRGRGRK